MRDIETPRRARTVFFAKPARAVLAVLSGLFILISPVWGDEVPGYPPVTKGWRAAQALLARMAQVYDVPPPRLQLDQTAHYRDGTVYMRDAILDMDVMEAVLAHEFAHYLFQHKGSLRSKGWRGRLPSTGGTTSWPMSGKPQRRPRRPPSLQPSEGRKARRGAEGPPRDDPACCG